MGNIHDQYTDRSSKQTNNGYYRSRKRLITYGDTQGYNCQTEELSNGDVGPTNVLADATAT
jgi:hypothetical protein